MSQRSTICSEPMDNGYHQLTNAEKLEENGRHRSCIGNGGAETEETARLYDEKWAEAVRKELMALLNSRHQKKVPFTVKCATNVKSETYQFSSLNNSNLDTKDLTNDGDSSIDQEFLEENIILQVEEGEQGNIPLLIMKRINSKYSEKEGCSPAIVILHGSYKSKESLHTLLKTYAKCGYVAIGVDSRYHGQRATSKTAYSDALICAWRDSKEMPFIFDTVWDLVQLMDYLTTRQDIDSKRIGISGISLGGMHAWFAAAIDPRFAVVVPIIGVQSFGWAIKNDRWHARVESISDPFKVAAKDVGKSNIDSQVVYSVLQKIAPNIVDKFNSENTIPAIAPRPLLILNGREDPRCPIEGLEHTIKKTKMVYENYGLPDNFKFVAEPRVGHHVSSLMLYEAQCWFDRFLQPQSTA